METETKNMLGNFVKFSVGGRKKRVGFVTSIEKGVANIKGIEQKKYEKPAYHLELGELIKLTHKQVFELGKNSKVD